MSAAARATATRPSSRPAAPRAAATRVRRPALAPVPPPAPSVAGNGMFAFIVAGLLVLGMVGLLVLNTTLAQGAFEIGSLTTVQRDLAVNEQRLLQTVARAESPESLEQRADELGMVPAGTGVPASRRPQGARSSDPRRGAGAQGIRQRCGRRHDADDRVGRSDAQRQERHRTECSGCCDDHLGDRHLRRSRPDAPTGPGMSDEARPDAPTGGSAP